MKKEIRICGFGGQGIILAGVVLGAVGLSSIFWGVGSESNPMFAMGPHWHLVIGGFAVWVIGTFLGATGKLRGSEVS